MLEKYLKKKSSPNCKVIILRYPNVVGSDPSGKLGEKNSFISRIMPLFYKNLINQKKTTLFYNFNAQSSNDLVVNVHPTYSNLVIIGGTKLWRSTDGFTTSSNTTIIGGYRAGSSEGDGNLCSYPNHHPDQH